MRTTLQVARVQAARGERCPMRCMGGMRAMWPSALNMLPLVIRLGWQMLWMGWAIEKAIPHVAVTTGGSEGHHVGWV